MAAAGDPSANGIRNRLIPGAAWAAALVASYFGIGGHLADKIEGIDSARLSAWPPIVAGVMIVAAIILTIRSGRASRAPDRTEEGTSRRRFLFGLAKVVGGAAAVAASVVLRLRGWMTVTGPAIAIEVPTTDPHPRPEWSEARIRAYRRLGRTGFDVSDIALGSGRINEQNGGEAIARAAIDRGVNYFDTAPDYSGAGSERALGRALKGHRDRMFLATKFCTPDGHLPPGSPVSEYVRVVEESLGRLQTDYVDLVHVHSCDRVERLLDPNLHEAFDRLREQGKARFLGVSTHTPNLESVASAAIESGRFDVMMLAYHHGAWPRLGEIIHRAAAGGMGVVAMKTLKGAKHNGLAGFRDDQSSYAQAAFRWVLSNSEVGCLVISFFEPGHVDEYLHASGSKLTGGDRAVLERYDAQIAGLHCRPHCGACLSSCPEDLAINDVLRHRMYFEDYGWKDEARRLYTGLAKQADVCLACPAPCAGACPDGIAIRQRTIGAHGMLA